jgi:hypothetical protein
LEFLAIAKIRNGDAALIRFEYPWLAARQHPAVGVASDSQTYRFRQ